MKITPAILARELGLSVLTGADSLEREVELAYCCDLLSFVMGRAPADCAWVTVMGNVNAVAVAVLADCACIILAEGPLWTRPPEKKPRPRTWLSSPAKNRFLRPRWQSMSCCSPIKRKQNRKGAAP